MGFLNLIKGFRHFQNDYFKNDSELYERLVNDGQSPKVMVIACSDSRIDPALLTQSQPGDIFSVRNIAAMVSPDDDSDHRGHGTAAAVEYAVKVLKVEHIIILGHALCGGVHALAKSGDDLEQDDGFIARWISIGADARNKVRHIFPDHSVDDQAPILEKTSILVSINNLMSYSWVRDAVEANTLKLHGWYFDMPHGMLLHYDPVTNKFEDTLASSVRAAIEAPNCDCGTSTISLTQFLNTLKGDKPAKKSCLCSVGVKIKRSAKAVSVSLFSPEVLTAVAEII
jgi:carbonic anhydrase